MIKCAGEPGTFDESEFRHDASGKLIVPNIHDHILPPHYTNGILVEQTIQLLMAHMTSFATAATYLKFVQPSSRKGQLKLTKLIKMTGVTTDSAELMQMAGLRLRLAKISAGLENPATPETLETPEASTVTTPENFRHNLLALALYQKALLLSTDALESVFQYATTFEQEGTKEDGQANRPKQAKQSKSAKASRRNNEPTSKSKPSEQPGKPTTGQSTSTSSKPGKSSAASKPTTSGKSGKSGK